MKKLGAKLAIFLAVLYLLIMIITGAIGFAQSVLVGAIAGSQSTSVVDSSSNQGLSPEVLQWKDAVTAECEANGIPDQVSYILAIIQVESGGNAVQTPDIMQCSESKGWPRNTIQDPLESIKIGVAYFASGYKGSPNTDILNVVQGYNYGYAFLSFADDTYSLENAIAYSNKQAGGAKVSYPNPVAMNLGYSWRYNYGNMFYAQLVKQFIGSATSEVGGEYNFILPVVNPQISSGFGSRVNPVTGVLSNHNGLDFAQPTGDRILAVQSGTVVVSQLDGVPVTGYGNCVIVKHNDNLYTLYAHMSNRAVSVGDTVSQGQLLGTVGSTGQSTGPHLHFEVRLSMYGDFIDPAGVLPL